MELVYTLFNIYWACAIKQISFQRLCNHKRNRRPEDVIKNTYCKQSIVEISKYYNWEKV
jgi:hypothetical protein